MAEIQVRRLPVFDRDKRPVGIVGDTATMAVVTETGEALSRISMRRAAQPDEALSGPTWASKAYKAEPLARANLSAELVAKPASYSDDVLQDCRNN